MLPLLSAPTITPQLLTLRLLRGTQRKIVYKTVKKQGTTPQTMPSFSLLGDHLLGYFITNKE
jgi:hypothetical protein